MANAVPSHPILLVAKEMGGSRGIRILHIRCRVVRIWFYADCFALFEAR